MNNKGLDSSYTSKGKRYNVAMPPGFIDALFLSHKDIKFTMSYRIRRCLESYFSVCSINDKYDSNIEVVATLNDIYFSREVRKGRKKQVAFVLPLALHYKIMEIQEATELPGTDIIRAIIYWMTMPF
jgi:hypothetical protein